MEMEGGCYCGKVRYRTSGPVLGSGLCFCRECQHVSGGGGTVAMIVPESGFAYTSGQPATFARPDLDVPAAREFCPTCGTQLATRSPRAAGNVIIKAGTLDDPAVLGQVQAASYVSEMQVYHAVPGGVPTFEKFPRRP
ncbi:MAG: GFA family protein [Novosphingobium sp.]|nr:GFA family protein [Novosphingobium sp.]